MAPRAQAADLAKAVRQIVKQLDPDQPIGDVMTMDKVLAQSLGVPRFYMQILLVFAAIAIFLAGIGIYGVMAYFVSQHTHDIGVRMALGARATDIVRWVGILGLRIVTVGILTGVALALGLTRLLSMVLFGVKPTDPLTYIAVAASLMAIACLACYIPARRAIKVDPLVALRYE
jgi:putative ABC transport system permease protein